MESLAVSEEKLLDLEAKLEAKKAQLRDLATMGAVITSIPEISTVLSVVMEMAIGLVNGEVGLIMVEEKGALVNKVSWGVDRELVRHLIYEGDQDVAAFCFQGRETVVLSDLRIKDASGISIETLIALPIKTAERCFGVMLIINKTDRSGFSDEDKELLEMFLRFVAVAIDNSLLVKDKLARLKIEQEMDIARQVQETILPRNITDLEGVDFSAIYFPAREVGGDYYDIIKLDNSSFILIIGDVSNKGVPAAMIMSAAAGIIKATIDLNPRIEMAELAHMANTNLCQGIIKDKEMFVTLFFAKFDFGRKTMTYCNAGHLPGLWWEDSRSSIAQLAVGGPIVGQFEQAIFKQNSIRFSSGDRLFLFTDGLTEAADSNGQLFGRERVEQVFSMENNLPPKEFCLKVKEWVDRFTVGSSEEAVDDFTIVQIQVK